MCNLTKEELAILEHRRDCPKWDNEFCPDCFGAVFSEFKRDLINDSVMLVNGEERVGMSSMEIGLRKWLNEEKKQC